LNQEWVIPLDWLPGETLYSWCVRYHQAAGLPTWVDTKQLLFGGRRTGILHGIPGCIDRFVARTQGVLGGADAIIAEHTILPVLTRFQLLSRLEQAVAEVRTSHRLNTARLGLTAAPFPASFPLKACPACMERDECLYQVAYWHVAHQLPGVWVCSEHRTLLAKASTPHCPSGGSGPVLPRSATFNHRHHRRADLELRENNHALAKLAATVLKLAALPMNQLFPPRDVLFAHATRARTSFGDSPHGRESTTQSYLAHCRELGLVWELSRAPQTAGDALHNIHTLLSPKNYVRHALQQMVFVSWLYESCQHFLAELDRQSRLREQDPTGTRDLYLAGIVSSDIARQLQERQISLRQAARRTGVPVADLHASTSNLGVAIGKQPGLPDAQQYLAIGQALANGLNKKDIASIHGVTTRTIELMIRRDPGLQEQWLAARFLSARENARSWWSAAVQSSPGASVSAIQRMNPAVSDWLRRNDLAWLRAHSPDSKRQSGSHSGTWNHNDAGLAQRVREIALQIVLTAGSQTPIRLSTLRKHIPELRMHSYAIDSMPLTSKAIAEVTALAKAEGTLLKPIYQNYH